MEERREGSNMEEKVKNRKNGREGREKELQKWVWLDRDRNSERKKEISKDGTGEKGKLYGERGRMETKGEKGKKKN